MYTTLVLLAYFATLTFRPELADRLTAVVWTFGLLLMFYRLVEINAFKSASEQPETDDDENGS